MRLLIIVFWCLPLFAADSLTVIQTSDLHSHFTNRDDFMGMGGYARIKTKVDEIKSQNENVLFLDAGDWSEGSIFFTLENGVYSQKIMDQMGYDAIVLGNHDWLIGPKALYENFKSSGLKTPVLSGNLDTVGLDKKVRIKDYIKPFIIKDFKNFRVGILGLSTFQLVFDKYFKPVKLIEPTLASAYWVNYLRAVKKCNVVIVLSHLGITQDELLANLVPGIDLIVGGHTHILLDQPKKVKNTPISHIGNWGRYVGEINLEIEKKKSKLKNFKLHKISDTVKEDSGVSWMVNSAVEKIQSVQGPVFSDVVLQSEVDLPVANIWNDSYLSDIATDAVCKFAKADVCFDTPNYIPRGLYRGVSSTVDVFNSFPHIYNPVTGKSWTIKTFEVEGYKLWSLVNLIFTMGFDIKVSGAEIVIDKTSKLLPLKKLNVGGEPIGLFKKYKLAGNDGIYQVVEFLKTAGLNLMVKNLTETGVESWRVIWQALKDKKAIGFNDALWSGRIRTQQPDLMLRSEDLLLEDNGDKLSVALIVRNAGMSRAKPSVLRLTASSEFDRATALVPFSRQDEIAIPFESLGPGEEKVISFEFVHGPLPSGRHPIKLTIDPDSSEFQTQNNTLETYF